MFAILPAMLATILIFMDQQITIVIVNRKEHLLKVSAYIFAYSNQITLDIYVHCRDVDSFLNPGGGAGSSVRGIICPLWFE